MKINRVLSALLAFVILACLSGVQGQYVIPLSSSSTTPSTAQSTSQYSQFYTGLTGSVQAHTFCLLCNQSHRQDPSKRLLQCPDAASSLLYISTNCVRQCPMDTGDDRLVTIRYSSQGTMVSLLAIAPYEGSGNVVLIDASGQKYNYSYFLYPTSQLSFYADAPGRHTLSFIAGGVESNPVVIDVSGIVTMTYTPTGNYYPPMTNSQVDYLGGYYPGNYVPRVSYGPQAALDNAAANKEYQKSLAAVYNYYNEDNPYAWDYLTYQWLNYP